MSRKLLLPVLLSCVFALVASMMAMTSTSAASAPRAARDRLEVYVGEVAVGQLQSILALGVDREALEVSAVRGERGAKATVRVEAILSKAQVARLRAQGVALKAKLIDGQTVTARATAQAAEGYAVYKKYAGAGGLKQEFRRVARNHPNITKLVDVGNSVNGQDIIALKVTKGAKKLKDGAKPAVLYLAAQHAREWITPEMIRRLMHHVVNSYRTKLGMHRLLNRHELWFLPVANPDGYDFTFQDGNRLWRKNLRDNDGNGEIVPGDGVDLNRNMPTKWGYDNEGSSDDPASETYRGHRPASEPETWALRRLARRVGFEFIVNYHSAAELLLYGTGWQVATPTPDDIIYEAMAGDDAHPAVPGFDPDISAELYTTNGDTNTEMAERFGALSFTPEMSTCEAASAVDPGDEWLPEDCGSGFEFPDDEGLIQGEYLKNRPFAISVARSAGDPDDPVSVVGRNTRNFKVDRFEVSTGNPQAVAVLAKRALTKVTMQYRINGGIRRTVPAPLWAGGERYGTDNNLYYAERRGVVTGTKAGDSVEVWFAGVHGKRSVASGHFNYTVESNTGADVLVIANEDYTGVNPTYPPEVTGPKYADQHVAAVEAAGHSADVWDVDAQGVPHDLGVLSHYDAVVWYLGDNRLTQDPEDELIDTPFGELPDIGVAERQQYLTIAVRDFLNEGGKLIHLGETAQYEGLTGISDAVGGLYYGLNGDPSAECHVDSVAGFFEDCLILANDFRQYYLGAFTRIDVAGPVGVVGAGPLNGFNGTFGGPVVTGSNPVDEAGNFTPTSDVLPVEEFPQFASEAVADYSLGASSPYAPVEGTRYAGVLHQDGTYARLTKTVDLTAATAAELQFQVSFDTEPSYDNVIVEARTPGTDDWTTLPEAGGATGTTPPAECVAGGFLLTMHPFLTHYLGGADCTSPGTTGTWNALTGNSGGWQQVAYDLTPFAGGQVEVSISYVTDPSSGGVGLFVDDTHVVIDGTTTSDGFEGDTSTWTPTGPPAGSPEGGAQFQIGGVLIDFIAGTSTADTFLFGFGLEQLDSDEDRADLIGRAFQELLG